MKKGALTILLLVVLITFASSEYELGNQSHQLAKEYGPGENIRGWVNISFAGESVDSIFKDSFGNEIILDDVLAGDPLFLTECQTIECQDDYDFYNGTTNTTFVLNKGVSQTAGFVLYNDISQIMDFNFTIQTNATSSCTNQLKINFLLNDSDNNYEFGNIQSDSQVCENASVNYSCYDETQPSTLAIVDDYSFCQKFTLPEAPGFRVGAWVKRESDLDKVLKIRLFDAVTNQYLTDCELNVPNGAEGEYSCDLNYLVTKQKDYYLCLYANTNTPMYKTKSTTLVEEGDGCGFYKTPGQGQELDSAYHIFFQPKKFKTFGEMKVNGNTTISNTNMTNFIKNLITLRYGSLDCRGGCVIPVRFYSTLDSQMVGLKDVSVYYQTNKGKLIEQNIYTIIAGPPRINANFQLLNLDNSGFKVPVTNGSKKYNFFFKNELLFTDNLSVGNVPIINGVSPIKAPLGYVTEFTADVTLSGANISKYHWIFDTTPITTTTNKATFEFGSLGLHNLTLSVVDTNNKNSTKKFIINVNTPEVQIQSDINNLNKKITDLDEDMQTMEVFEKQYIDNLFNITAKKALLSDAEYEFQMATNVSDYLEILNLLSEITLPESIEVTDSSSQVIFFPSESEIDLEAISQATATDYETTRSEDYKRAVLSWNQKNVETRITYKSFSYYMDGQQEHLASFIDVATNDNLALSTTAYLFIRKMNGMDFESNYAPTETDYFYILDLSSGRNFFSFATTEETEFENLPLFISPALTELSLGQYSRCSVDSDCLKNQYCDDGGACVEKPTNKWVFFGLAIIFLIIIAFVVYLILFNWYKNKYETYLFKDRNNLFNLVTYINHQKRKGLSNDDIEKNLKKAKWKNEQITYAMRKYEGKNTGMFELPLLKLIFGKKPPQASDLRRPSFGIGPSGIPPGKFNPRGPR